MTTTTDPVTEAIREACNSMRAGAVCSWPDCYCHFLPRAVAAGMEAAAKIAASVQDRPDIAGMIRAAAERVKP